MDPLTRKSPHVREFHRATGRESKQLKETLRRFLGLGGGLNLMPDIYEIRCLTAQSIRLCLSRMAGHVYFMSSSYLCNVTI